MSIRPHGRVTTLSALQGRRTRRRPPLVTVSLDGTLKLLCFAFLALSAHKHHAWLRSGQVKGVPAIGVGFVFGLLLRWLYARNRCAHLHRPIRARNCAHSSVLDTRTPTLQGPCGCRARKMASLHELSLPHRRWVQRIQRMRKTFREPRNQGPYWSPLLTTRERCEWLNIALRKMWPVYDRPVCSCAPPPREPLPRRQSVFERPVTADHAPEGSRAISHLHPCLQHGQCVRHGACRATIEAVDPILRRFMPPGFLSLRVHRLKFGSRAPEILSMRVFSVRRQGIVLHAHMRFVGSDLQAVLLGRLVTGHIYAGEHAATASLQSTLRMLQFLRIPQDPHGLPDPSTLVQHQTVALRYRHQEPEAERARAHRALRAYRGGALFRGVHRVLPGAAEP